MLNWDTNPAGKHPNAGDELEIGCLNAEWLFHTVLPLPSDCPGAGEASEMPEFSATLMPRVLLLRTGPSASLAPHPTWIRRHGVHSCCPQELALAPHGRVLRWHRGKDGGDTVLSPPPWQSEPGPAPSSTLGNYLPSLQRVAYRISGQGEEIALFPLKLR